VDDEDFYIAPGDMPELPDENAKWLWISDNFADEGSAGWICLYAVRARLEGDMSDFSLKVNLSVWKWDESTDVSTQIIDKDLVILRSPIAATTTWVESGWANPTRWHILGTPSEGYFTDEENYKWGDVRHGRIVIMGATAYYNELDQATFYGNTELNCWDLDGVHQWSINLKDYSGVVGFVPIEDSTGAHNYRQSYEFDALGYPATKRVRIAENKSVHILTDSTGRAPHLWGWKWEPGVFPPIKVGASAIPGYWCVSEDVTGTPLPVEEWATYGKWNGFTYEDVELSYFEDGDDRDNGPYIQVQLQPNSTDPTGFIIRWGAWDDLGGSLDPADYYLLLYGPPGGPLTLPVTTTEYDTGEIDMTVGRHFYVEYWEQVDPGDDILWGTSNNVFYNRTTHNTRLSSFRDMDATARGNAFISGFNAAGHGLTKVIYDPGVILFDDSTTNPNGYRGERLEETHSYTFREGSAEYAGPIWADEYNDVFPAPEPPNEGDGNDVWVLRAGANGTYLVRITLNNPNTLPYQVNRIWSCSYWPSLQLERAEYQSASISLLGHLHSMAFSGRAIESDPPCPPCDPPLDDPCNLCPDKTRKPAWEMIDHPLKDDAALDHLATRFMRCQLLQGGQVNNVLVDGVIVNNVPVHESCRANYNLYVNYPPLFRQYTRPGDTDENCWWQLCGKNIKLCEAGYVDVGGTPTLRIVCSDSGQPMAALGLEGDQFVLYFWIMFIDLSTGIEYGPSVLAKYQAEDVSMLCGPEAVFNKIIDNSLGEDPTRPYYNLPYFRDTIRMRRVAMDTECDIPEPPPPEPWCPGDPNPPEKLCYGVEITPGVTVSEPEYPGEPTPPDLDYDGTNTWTNGSATFESDCGFVLFTWGLDFTLICSDVNDPGATWQLQVDWTTSTGGPPSTGTAILNPLPPGATCPPLAMTFDIQSGSLASGTLPPFVDCNAISFGVEVSVFECPAAAMPSRARRITVKKKTPDEVPCTFRGGYLQTISCCGDVYQCKNKEVYALTGYRACTINQNSSGLMGCVGCPYRTVTDQTAP
jgi:hypothetical protein